LQRTSLIKNEHHQINPEKRKSLCANTGWDSLRNLNPRLPSNQALSTKNIFLNLMNITPPTIHLNGTSPQELWKGYEAAYDAVRAAQEALNKIEFNARDYYVQSPLAWGKAQDDRYEQRRALDQVEEYLLQHLLAIRRQSGI